MPDASLEMDVQEEALAVERGEALARDAMGAVRKLYKAKTPTECLAEMRSVQDLVNTRSVGYQGRRVGVFRATSPRSPTCRRLASG